MRSSTIWVSLDFTFILTKSMIKIVIGIIVILANADTNAQYTTTSELSFEGLKSAFTKGKPKKIALGCAFHF